MTTATTPTTSVVAPASSWFMSADGGDVRGPVVIVGHHLCGIPLVKPSSYAVAGGVPRGETPPGGFSQYG